MRLPPVAGEPNEAMHSIVRRSDVARTYIRESSSFGKLALGGEGTEGLDRNRDQNAKITARPIKRG